MMNRRLCLAVFALAVAATAAPAATARTHLNAAERRGVNRTLDAFVPAAVRRDDPLAALGWTAPSLRAGTTRSQWRRGEIPVYPYPAKGKRFHGWTFSYRDGREVGVELQLHSLRPKRVGPITFKVSLVRHRGRWLVSGFIPAATFAPVGGKSKVTAEPDFAPGAMADVGGSKSKLGRIWLLVPLSVLGLSVLLALGYPLFKWQRERRELRRT